MDVKKFEITLKKIITLKETIDLSGEDISRLEIELLKNYVKKLYETISFDDEEFIASEDKPKKKKKKKLKEKLEAVKEEVSEIVEESIVEEIPEVIVEEEVIEIIEETIVDVKEEKVYDETLIALFERSSTSELSEKLSSRPITDMKKAMGINEKIFTVNEMFGGDNKLFNDIMEKLNSLNNFDEAKDYLLENVAVKFDWAKPENHKKVKMFIKLVQRRYN